MTPSQIEQYRPGFEAWAIANLPGRTLSITRYGDVRQYAEYLAEWAWQAWLASKADSQVVTEEMVERAARAMKPDHFAIYGSGYTARNYIEENRFLNAEKVVKRARKDALKGLSAALNPIITPVDGMEANDV